MFIVENMRNIEKKVIISHLSTTQGDPCEHVAYISLYAIRVLLGRVVNLILTLSFPHFYEVISKQL